MPVTECCCFSFMMGPKEAALLAFGPLCHLLIAFVWWYYRKDRWFCCQESTELLGGNSDINTQCSKMLWVFQISYFYFFNFSLGTRQCQEGTLTKNKNLPCPARQSLAWTLILRTVFALLYYINHATIWMHFPYFRTEVQWFVYDVIISLHCINFLNFLLS